MPVINFTKADVLRSRNLESDKWYSWQIARVEGPKASKGGDSYNYTVVLSLIDHSPETDGKEINRMYNTKAISMMIPLIAAVKGINQDEIEADKFTFDLDELVGKKIDGKHKLENYEGSLIPKVEEYLPYKKIVGQPVPF